MEAGPSSSRSPRALSGPRLCWVLLSIFWSRAHAQTPEAREILGVTADTTISDEVATRLIVYLTRAWDEIESPPASLEELCHVLAAILDPDSDPACTEQVNSIVRWLFGQLTITDKATVGRSTMSPWLDSVFDAAVSFVFSVELEGVHDVEDRLLDRRSPVALALRRMRLSYDSLDHMRDIALIERDLKAWRDGRPIPSSSRSIPLLPDRAYLFQQYKKAIHRGDYSAEKELLHRFFDCAPAVGVRGPTPGQRSNLHHHALLNLAGFQTKMEEWAVAEQTLKEAIHLARVEKDAACLEACQSLMKRLEAATKGEGPSKLGDSGIKWKPSDRSAQRARLTPDDLWDAMHSAAEGQSSIHIQSAMERVIDLPLAVSLRTLPNPGNPQPSKANQNIPTGEPARTSIARSLHRPSVALASLSSQMGNVESARSLRRLHREEPYHSDEGLRMHDELSMRCEEAYELAEEGKYDEGLSLFLDRELIEWLSLERYREWTKAIYRVLYLRSRRLGDVVTAKRLARLSIGKDSLPECGSRPIDVHLSSPVSIATSLISAHQGIRAIPYLTSLLTDAEASSHLIMHRRGTVLLAQVEALYLDLPEKARQTIEAIMPEILTDHNLERRGEASFIYAQILLSSCSPDSPSQSQPHPKADCRSTTESSPSPSPSPTEVMEWLFLALDDFVAVQCLERQLQTLSYLARLFHRLGDLQRRDDVAQRYVDVQARLEGNRRSARGNGRIVEGKEEVEKGLAVEDWEDLIGKVGRRITDSVE